MKLKYYMQGLAVGIMFSVFIFTLTGASQKEKLSETEIKNAALALGMVEKESNINLNVLTPTKVIEPTVTVSVTTTPEPTKTVTPTKESTITPQPTVAPTTEPTVTPTPQTTATPTIEPTKAPEPTKEVIKKETITLNVVKGMYSSAVAQKAYELGLVDDAKKFDNYLKDNGYASIIRINTYVFEKGATYYQIAETITKRPE